MKTPKNIIISLGIVIIGFFSAVSAQWGMDPWAMTMNQYNQRMDLYVQQQMQMAQQQADQAYANVGQFFIDYYRQNTGDYSTPDTQALYLGDQLYCQHNPAQCQQNIRNAQTWSDISAAGHQQNMNNIAGWGQTMNQIGQMNGQILDMSYNGYMDRSQMQYQGQQKYVQEGIYGTTTYVDPNGNSSYSGLPINAYDGMVMQTANGQNIMFDQASQSWYLLDPYGYPVQQLEYGY